jgi:hypothetical protein
MSISPTSSAALQGLQQASRGMRRSAAEIAGNNTGAKFPTKDLVRAMVELHQHSHQAIASISAFKTGDQIIGSLLDIKA